MTLRRARVTNYKSIDDSSWVAIDEVTCLVGKNESGKTAFLQALLKLNPSDKTVAGFDPILEYPKKRYATYKRKHETDPDIVVTAEYELDDEEVGQVEASYGRGCLASRTVTVSKDYNNTVLWNVELNEPVIIAHFVDEASVGSDLARSLKAASDVEALKDKVEGIEDKTEALRRLESELGNWLDVDARGVVVREHLQGMWPKYLYFDDYSVLPGDIVIEEIVAKDKQLEDSERTFLALLDLVSAKPADFQDADNYEKLKAELEAAQIGITDEVFAYWSQNKNLEVEFDIGSRRVPADPRTGTAAQDRTVLHLRIKNIKHRVTVPFSNRSRGFVWFFSFFAYFSAVERQRKKIVLLLDEPGLNLHGKAQGDFLKLIDERLAPNHQVVYSTHSPFMIEAKRLDRVRTVEDTENRGTVVSADVLRTDRDTVFPLQAALGYDLAQTLFLGPNCLLVEGPSDLLYLQVLSDACESSGRAGLDTRWVVTPVGGADKLATFVSLIGANDLNVAVLMDINPQERQRVDRLVESGLLTSGKVLTIAQFAGASSADVEDLFTPAFYLELFNGAFGQQYGKTVSEADVASGDPRVLRRIEADLKKNGRLQGRLDHYKPSAYLLRKQADLVPRLDDATLDRFEAAFKAVNALVG